jgi:(p)ppGpp synthase/HD superfamily hydrolase
MLDDNNNIMGMIDTDVDWNAGTWAAEEHRAINQTYDSNLDYAAHLSICAALLNSYLSFMTEEDKAKFNTKALKAAIWLHDLIEDSHRVNYHTILDKFGKDVAEIVFLVTDCKGRNRAERHNDAYFSEIAASIDAALVKICDFYANSLYSRVSGSSMYRKYQKEYGNLKEKLYRPEFETIFTGLSYIFNPDSDCSGHEKTVRIAQTKFKLK